MSFVLEAAGEAGLDGVYLDGAFRRGRGDALVVLDPSTGDELAEVSLGDARDVDDAVASAATASRAWADASPVERSRVCARAAALLLERVGELSHLVARDAGLPLTLARRDVETAARYFEFYAGLADKLLGDSIPVEGGGVDFTLREPWGVCGILLPFNFPLQLTARDLAPALATGNAVVLKPPEQAPLAALALTALCAEAGVPEGVVTAVTGLGPVVGDALVRHDSVNHITFTGSVATARRVLAAGADAIKPATIELGGKSPHVVSADADVDAAVASIVGTTFKTAGQACSAGTRILAERSVHDALLAKLVAALSALQVGAALDDPDVGPLISAVQRDAVVGAVATAADAGADVLAGDGDVPADGFFVLPTVLTGVAFDTDAAQHEIFGPVATVLTFDDEGEAVALANATSYGLVAGIWTRDVGRAVRLARRIRAGQVFVNSYGVGGGVELPFGGYGRSGFGRVKGVAGALEYTQVKNVYIDAR